MPTYSFGEESPLKFEIPDKMAELYNEAVKQFFKAQVRFNQKFGRKWNPQKDPIDIKWTKKQRQAWNDFAKVFQKAADDQVYYVASDIMDDFLVKNTVSAASVGGKTWGRAISMSAACGALYVLLRGL